jgi:hypothetical protein
MLSDNQAATRGKPRVALITCADFPDLDPDERLLLGPLAARGIRAEPVVWDAPGSSLFLGYAEGAAERPADAIAARSG